MTTRVDEASENLAYARAAAYRVMHACRCRGERPDCVMCSCALEALENAARAAQMATGDAT